MQALIRALMQALMRALMQALIQVLMQMLAQPLLPLLLEQFRFLPVGQDRGGLGRPVARAMWRPLRGANQQVRAKSCSWVEVVQFALSVRVLKRH
jgi:hypothetical protein